MDSDPVGSADAKQHPQEPSPRVQDRVVVLMVIGLVLFCVLWALRTGGPGPGHPVEPGASSITELSPDKVPLTTGEEPITEIFTRAGCPVCHSIPGIPGANGQVGPKLVLGTTGTQRISSSAYRGQATTVHDYVVESVLDPERYVVPGYPGRTMPGWYGSKLSALALEKIATYLEQQMEGGSPPG